MTALRIAELLDGLTLAEAALLADDIKDWERTPPSEPEAFHLPDHPGIEAQLVAFVKANPATNNDPLTLPPNHYWFHYTDVPVEGDGDYRSGDTGRLKWDVVQMIPFCVDVLQGKTPATNDRKITKPVALLLLAHYLGDIHQPLHVGAQYFDKDGKPVDPDAPGAGAPTFSDNGGNLLLLLLQAPGGHSHAPFKLHSYWDDETVKTALTLERKAIRAAQGTSEVISPADIARWLASHEPTDWKPPSSLEVKDWSIAWADEILPAAREAHRRLEFTHIKLHASNKTASGQAIEKPVDDGSSYKEWSGQTVRDGLHRAGWRLARLLEEALKE